jgi:hypothetical protein
VLFFDVFVEYNTNFLLLSHIPASDHDIIQDHEDGSPQFICEDLGSSAADEAVSDRNK